MQSDPVQITIDGRVTIIRINRPHRRNAINLETANALRAAWLAFEADETQRVAILTGGDSVFCAGADLKEISELDIAAESGPLGFTRLFVSKPTIAAVAGYAVAGGLELACWCDLRVVDSTAQFGCLERRFGVPLVDGLTVRLPQIIGLGRALDLIMTGRLIDADEAHAIGLVNERVPEGKHLARALELAHQLAAFPQVALRNDRRSVYENLGRPMTAALAREAELGVMTWASGEGQSGAMQFSEGSGRHAATLSSSATQDES